MPGCNCVIKGCNNSYYHIKKWREVVCPTHDVNFGVAHCTCPPPFQLFVFPKEDERKRQWIKLVNRQEENTGKPWKPSKNSRICSRHFTDGEPTEQNPDPCLFLGYDVPLRSKRPPPKARSRTSTDHSVQGLVQSVSVVSESEAATAHPAPAVPADPASVVSDHCYTAPHSATAETDATEETGGDDPSFDLDHSYATAETECSSCETRKQQLHRALTDLAELNIRHSKLLRRNNRDAVLPCHSFIASDKDVKLNTGLPNRCALDSLFGLLQPRALKLRYWVGAARTRTSKYRRYFRKTPRKFGPKRSLSCKDEFVLTLMKLRLGLTTTFLANIFGISIGTCSCIFNTWVKFLARELRCLILWPTKEQIQTFMPKSLKVNYRNLRCIIDCSETFIERPRDLKLQACTWSDYKQHNTVKYLIAITPDGLISFVSAAYGGRTTDRYIVQKSGFLDLIEPYDLIMADRGFTIREDLLFRMASLTIPPASAGLKQMSAENVKKTKRIANARIHVERAINRIKWYKVLSTTIPVSMVPLFDDILTVCAALTNLLHPLVCK